jgi:protein gp37
MRDLFISLFREMGVKLEIDQAKMLVEAGWKVERKVHPNSISELFDGRVWKNLGNNMAAVKEGTISLVWISDDRPVPMNVRTINPENWTLHE